MTSATDELRRLLDERGVEWEDHSGSIEQRTVYRTPNGWCYVSTASDKWLSYVEYHDMTPEQAIDATLGRGTCHRVMYKPTNTLVCSECGAGMPKQLDRYCYLHYCPNCGRKVTDG